MDIFKELKPSKITDLIDFADAYLKYAREIRQLECTLRNIEHSQQKTKAGSEDKQKRYHKTKFYYSKQKIKNTKMKYESLKHKEKLFEKKHGRKAWKSRCEMLETLVKIKHSLLDISNMIGMSKVKNNIFDLILCVLQNMTKDALYNVCITGAPGRGKTQLARYIAKLYFTLDIVKSPVLCECRRDSLIGGYLGQTSIKSQKLFDKAKKNGQVIFLDEVSSMGCSGRSSSDSYAKEAIDKINQYLYNNKDVVMIVAGYGREAVQNVYNCFFDHNPGLIRRFPFVFNIEAYSPDELSQIFKYQVKKACWTCENDSIANKSWFEKNKVFFEYGGGDTEILLERIKIVHACRVFSMENKYRKIITNADLEAGFIRYKEYKNKKEETTNIPTSMYI